MLYFVYPFFHLSVDEHLGFFRLLVIVNHAAVNVSVQISVQVPAVYINSFGYIHRNGVARSCGNGILFLN